MNFITKYLKQWKQRAIDRELEERKQAERALRMESDVPWYKLIGQPYKLETPPTESVATRYEWNPAFIRQLREQGHVGETDMQVIENWEKKIATERNAKAVELDRKIKRESDEPWVEVVSERYDETKKQVEMKLDWNFAFVKMLRENGYSGHSEQEIIDKWFKRISQEIAGNLNGGDFGV